MKVYIVEECQHYESSTILGVYDDISKAVNIVNGIIGDDSPEESEYIYYGIGEYVYYIEGSDKDYFVIEIDLE